MMLSFMKHDKCMRMHVLVGCPLKWFKFLMDLSLAILIGEIMVVKLNSISNERLLKSALTRNG